MLHFQDLMYKLRIGRYECAELLQSQEGRPVPYHVVKDEVAKATVVLWGCVVDKVYDLKYPSKRWIHWRLLRENWLKVFKSGANFFFLPASSGFSDRIFQPSYTFRHGYRVGNRRHA